MDAGKAKEFERMEFQIHVSLFGLEVDFQFNRSS